MILRPCQIRYTNRYLTELLQTESYSFKLVYINFSHVYEWWTALSVETLLIESRSRPPVNRKTFGKLQLCCTTPIKTKKPLPHDTKYSTCVSNRALFLNKFFNSSVHKVQLFN